MFCMNCGAELSEGARFCKKCGHPAGVAPARDNGETPAAGNAAGSGAAAAVESGKVSGSGAAAAVGAGNLSGNGMVAAVGAGNLSGSGMAAAGEIGSVPGGAAVTADERKAGESAAGNYTAAGTSAAGEIGSGTGSSAAAAGRSTAGPVPPLPPEGGQKNPSGKKKKKGPVIALVIVLVLLVVGAGAFGVYYFMHREEEDDTGSGRRRDREKTEESEEAEETGEESEESEKPSEPEIAAEEMLQEYLDGELVPGYSYTALEPQTRTFAMSDDTYSRWQEYSVWTGISGIADTEIEDLDGDGAEELLLVTVDGENIGIQVYEAQGDAVVKQAEALMERSSDLELFEDAWTMLEGGNEKYLLFTQARMGVMADGYTANLKLYRYDGEKLYVAMEILQTAGGSSDFIYTAYRYDENGQLLAEEAIYDEWGGSGQILDSAHCSARMKALFAEYGISVRDNATMHGADHFLEKLLASEADAEILVRLYMRTQYQDEQVVYYFGTRNSLANDYHDFLDGKKTARVREGVSGMLDPGTDYTIGDILREVKALYLEYTDNKEITLTEYAFLDCGNDGEEELALRFTGLGIYSPGDDSDLIMVLSDKNGTLEIIYTVESWARSWTDVNYYGCISSSGSSGAGDNSGFVKYIDTEGNIQTIYEWNDLWNWWTNYVSNDAYRQAFGNNDEHNFQVTIWRINGSEYYEAIVDEAYGDQCRRFIELCQEEGKQFVIYREMEILIGQRMEELGVQADWVNGNRLRWNAIRGMR